MSSSLHHTRARRAVDAFRAINAQGELLGLRGQLLEDAEFQGDTAIIKGRKLANFGLCSYLGLGTDERLIEGAIDAVRRFGTSYSSSVAYTALGLYGDLTERLAAMLGAPVVVAGTTTLAHLSALPILVGKGDLVVIDAQAHASLLSVTPTMIGNGADIEQIPHNDLTVLAELLAKVPSTRPVWFITDGIFSMHGDTVPAENLSELLGSYPNLHAYIDDAHGFGWDGERGMGNYLRRVGWHDRVVVAVGLAKSFGTVGGVVATPDADMIELIRLAGGPMVFGGPIPPADLGAGVASADIHLSDELPGLQQQLNERISHVNRFSAEIGLPLSRVDQTPLWFLEIGKGQHLIQILIAVQDAGFFLNGAVFPVVPRGRAGVRFTVTNYNSIAQIEDMLVALNDKRLEVQGETEIEIDLAAEKKVRGPAAGG
jgi:7-keto-8-aminopelargonate synthetase-like enzyme